MEDRHHVKITLNREEQTKFFSLKAKYGVGADSEVLRILINKTFENEKSGLTIQTINERIDEIETLISKLHQEDKTLVQILLEKNNANLQGTD